jgi:ABC-type Fe3+/spermidine/putrescine transport system ATPase subunit
VVLGGVAQRLAVTRANGGAPIPRALAVLRPEALAFAPAADGVGWPGVVTHRRFAGATTVYHVRLGDGAGSVNVEVTTPDRQAHEGERVRVRVAREPVALVADSDE